MSEEKKNSKPEELSFEKEISRLPPEIKEKIEKRKSKIDEFISEVKSRAKNKSMGFYITAAFEMENNVPKANFEKLTIHFLLDDFDRPVQYFEPKVLFGNDYEKFISEKKLQDDQGQPYYEFYLKSDESIRFVGQSISILRENCFDSIYDDLKMLGSSLVHTDERGFISALKTIDIHRNMILQKFEKYVVVYAGAGSWLRGEKSNDFDVFIVIDDTDVKRMPRLQVKDQLTKLIWQMSREVAAVTGIQIHIQVYLLTDFWDALKDAHPVMFTFLRDGVPFYDRGLYSSWKELLKLGKIRPSPEAIDMHMNAGTQLIDRAKRMFADIFMNEVHYAVLNPSQALLMLKGYNPTTPKETVKILRESLLEKEKIVSEEDVETLDASLKLWKELEHNKNIELSGEELDKRIKKAEKFLQNIKKLFEKIADEKVKESVVTSYNEFVNQIGQLPEFSNLEEKELLKSFEEEFIKGGKLPSFTKESFKNIVKAKEDYDKGKIGVTEVNKTLKEIRNVLAEVKTFRDRNILSEVNRRKLSFMYDKDGSAELFNYDGKIYLFDFKSQKTFVFEGNDFKTSEVKKDSLVESTKFKNLDLNPDLFLASKKVLKAKEIFM